MPRFVKRPVLDIMRAIMNKLGSPQDSLKFIHVAGTNGKGSACAYLSCICREHGMKTGMFTSPFVIDFRERFQINGEMISESELCETTQQVKTALDELGEEYLPPQFGLITAIGLLWFYKKQCDIVVFEVGLGGRTDPTNIIKTPLCSVIMQIGMDHTDRLGDNIGKIAFEKGGIIKPSGITVLYPLQKEQTVNVIRSMSIQSQSRFIYPSAKQLTDVRQTLGGSSFTRSGQTYEVGISGKCQPYNALTVIEAVHACLPEITDDEIKRGLKRANLPARIHVLRRDPALVIDGGHNEDAVDVLSEFILQNRLKPVCVIGMMSDKDIDGYLAKLGPLCLEIYAVQAASERSEPAADIAKRAHHYCDYVKVSYDMRSLLEKLIKEKKDLLICGSLFVANEAYKILNDLNI